MNSDVSSSLRVWGVIFWLASVGLGSITQAQPKLTVDRLTATSVQLSWPGADTGFQLEASSQLGALAAWQAVTPAPALNAGRLTVTVQPADSARFFRLRSSAGVRTSILETSPASGEAGVAVTRETILRFSAPLAQDVLLTGDDLFAEFGGRELLARAELSSDRRTATLFYLENLPASARVRVSLNAARLRDATGKLLDADGDGQPGGTRVIEFNTAGITGLPNTAILGKVFASEKNADGSNKPLENVTVTVDGAEETLRTTTDATGSFKLQPAPAGRFFVHVDGRTAIGSQWPGGAYYPFVGKAWEAVAGKTNNLAGGSGEIFLPLIQSDALRSVSATEVTKVTFAASVLAANPALAGVEVNVPANALFSDNGVRGGMVGIAPVPPDRLPEPLPLGLNMPLVITVQTDGGSNFDRPVPVKFPNLPDPVTGIKLAPGEKTALWSFNHDTGRWEIQGTMTISPDGNFAVSDPGVGIRQPGWHGVAAGNRGAGPRSFKGQNGGGGNSAGNPPENCEGDDCNCTQEIFCVVPKAGKNVATCALECLGNVVDDIFGDGEKPVRTAFETGLRCIGGPDSCPGRPEDSLNKKRRVCMSECLQPTPDVTSIIVPCEGFFDPCPPKAAFRKADVVEAVLPDRLVEQQKVWELEEDFLVKLTGTPQILESESADVPKITALFDAFATRVRAGTPSGIHLSATERAELLALPRPAQFSAAGWAAVIDRLDSLQGAPVPADLALADKKLTELTEELNRRGWQYRGDGLLHGLARRSKHAAPVLGSAAFPARNHFYYLKNHRSGFVQRGRLSSSGTFEGLILAPGGFYTVAYLDPVTRRAGAAFFQAGSAGRQTFIPTAPLEDVPITEADSDGDGLADTVEKIVGINPLNKDTDGDGTPDAAEILNGTNPSDGTPTIIGVIANTDTPGRALGVVAFNNHAFVADGSGGLAVFQLNGIAAPTLAASLRLPGEATAIAGTGNLVALATGTSVTIMDVGTPSAPRVLHAVELGRQVRSVAMQGNQIAAAVDGELAILNAGDGRVTQRLSGHGTLIHDVQLDGTRMFALSEVNLLAFQLADNQWEFVSSVPAPTAANLAELRPTLLVSGAVARVGVAQGRNTGIISLDVSLLAAMHVVTPAGPNFPTVQELAPTGSSLLAAVTSGVSPRAISLYEAGDPQKVPLFVSSFRTPGTVQQTAVYAGLLLAADGEAGLTLINFLQPDRGTNAPKVSVRLANNNALQRAEFGSLADVVADAIDDVGVRAVEVELDGVVVASGGAAPFQTVLRLPEKSSGRTSVTLRARATDLAGNSAWSPPLVISLVDDARIPAILSLSPPAGAVIVPGDENQVSASFDKAIATPVTSGTLALVRAGVDGSFGTADDASVPGSVRYEPVSRSIIFTPDTPLGPGRYQATLAAGVGDTAGNLRSRPFPWIFQDTPLARVISLPAAKTVDLGGTLQRIPVGFDRSLAKSIQSGLTWKVLRLADQNSPQIEITPLAITSDVIGSAFTINFPVSLATATYRLMVSGPGIEAASYDFSYRNVPNEWILHESGAGTWKYSPGPVEGDALIINAPGQLAIIESWKLRSITAHTDVRFGTGLGAVIDVAEPIQIFAGLELIGSRFKAGTTHVYGLLSVRSSSDFNPIVIGPHTLNAYGGGHVRTAMHFPDPNGALVNHPGSTLVLSNGALVINTGVNASNAGRIVNLGTLRSVGNDVRLQDVRVRNDGRLEVASGLLKMSSVDNEGMIDVSAGAKLLLPLRARGGVSSRLAGTGTVEFGEFNSSTRRIVASADAELKGEVDPGVAVSLVAGRLTLWKPLLQQPERTLSLQNGSTLRLLSSARLGAVALLGDSTLSFNTDSQIASLAPGSSGTLEAATVTRVTGDATFSGLNAHGPGIVVFEGLTLVSNGTQTANLGIGHATVRNLGNWRQSANGAAASAFTRRSVEGQPGRGAFENLGRFEQTTDRALVINVPFRNAGFVSLRRGPVAFDARTITDNAGAYLPRPGSELVLNNTDFQHHFAGTLDLAAGILRGTGNIGAVDGNTRPRVINRAVLRPGNPTGDLTIRATGGFEQTATGELAVTLASNGHSRLLLNGTTAALAGTLRVELAEGFSPAAGQTFTVLSFSSRTGEFENVILPNVGAGKKLEVVYSPSAVTVRVVVP